MGQLCLVENRGINVPDNSSYRSCSSSSDRSKVLLRLLFVGPSGAGKSSIIHQLAYQKFSLATAQTRCAHPSMMKLPNQNYIQMIDTVGEIQDLARIPQSIIEKLDGIVYVYEQGNLNSLEKVISFQDWIHRNFFLKFKENIVIQEFLIANKIDQITTNKPIQNLNQYHTRFNKQFSTSALWEKELLKTLYQIVNSILIEKEDILNMIFELSASDNFLSEKFKSSFSEVFKI